MMGSIFAGCDKVSTYERLYQGRKYKGIPRHGLHRRHGKRKQGRYFRPMPEACSEGVEGRVLHKGTVEDTVFQLVGSRAGMGYWEHPISDPAKNG